MTELKKEWAALWQGRYPKALFYLVPLVLCLLFGAVYEYNTVRHIHTVVYDQSQSSISRNLIQVYDDSERFDIVAYATSYDEAEAMLKDGTAYVAITIPKNFAKDIRLGQKTNVGLIVNSANNLIGNAALSAMREINRSFSVGISTKLIESYGVVASHARDMVYPIRLGTRILNNPTTGYTPFMLPGLVLNGLQIVMLIMVGPLFVTTLLAETQRSTWREKIGQLWVKLVPHFFLGLLSFLIALVAFHYVWAVPVKGSILELLLLLAAYLIAISGILCLFSSISPNPVYSLQLPLLYVMPGLLFSGLSWPMISMVGFAKFYSSIMPITYTVDTMRDLLLAGYAPTLYEDALTLFVMGALPFLLASAIYTFRLRRMVGKEG